MQGLTHPHSGSSFRNFELSLQSPLHPSIALLVHYRSQHGYSALRGTHLAVRAPFAKSSTRAATGAKGTPPGRPTVSGLQHRAVTLDRRSFHTLFSIAWPWQRVFAVSGTAHPASLWGRGASREIPPREGGPHPRPMGWVSDNGMSCLFTRRYWGNRCCFLFLLRLICLS